MSDKFQLKIGKVNVLKWAKPLTGVTPHLYANKVYFDDDNKTVVATNGNVMIAVRSLYREFGTKNSPKGTVLDIDGNLLDEERESTIFPPYESIFDSLSSDRALVSRDGLKEILNQAKEMKEELAEKGTKIHRIFIKVGRDYWVQWEYAKLMLKMPTWKFYFTAASNAILQYDDDDIRAVIMPVRMLNSTALHSKSIAYN